MPKNETTETIQIKRLLPEYKLYRNPIKKEYLVNVGNDKTITQNRILQKYMGLPTWPSYYSNLHKTQL